MTERSVVIAPDSFKGSLAAADVAAAIAQGWREVRAGDSLVLLPQADGGEGTMDAVEATQTRSTRHWVDGVTGPDGRPVRGCWLELADGTAVTELAQMSGLPLMQAPDPLNATSFGLGQVIDDAVSHGVKHLIVGLGGSASTDGAAGALVALGLELLDVSGRPLPTGGSALDRLASIRGAVRRPERLTILTDVTSPLLGPTGAAAVFGPQKGALPAEVAVLDAALARLAAVLGGPTDLPGMGAAGGCGYGLVTGLGGTLVPGAAYISRLTGYDDAVRSADVVISGEGRFDSTSLQGKVVGHVLGLAARHGARRAVVAGQVAVRPGDLWTESLVGLAGAVPAAMADPHRWLVEAGRRAAAALG